MARQDETPLMLQWRDAKTRHPDALVFFRVGDFYELFNEDAEEGARLLGLTLTSRNNGGAANVPLAGVPARARDEYVERLLRLGRRVAVCEQMEDPSQAKGIVRREVVETVTPGAILSDTLLTETRNNYLVAVVKHAAEPEARTGRCAIAAADASTGEVIVTLVEEARLQEEIARFEPAEILVPISWTDDSLPEAAPATLTRRPDWWFDPDAAAEELRRRYRIHSHEGLGFEVADAPLLGALGALLAYLAEVQPAALSALRAPRIERADERMTLDEMTRRNLELIEPLRVDAQRGARSGTLIEVLDETLTPMGARLLRSWLLRPLVLPERIWSRQESIAFLLDDAPLRRALRSDLKQVRDLERLAAKAGAGRALPRDLLALRDSLGHLPALRAAVQNVAVPLLAELAVAIDPLDDVRAMLLHALADDATAIVGEGGVLRPGFDAELDELRNLRDGGQDTIAQLQSRERQRSGIPSLKIGYNKVFGYYIEVTRANAERVPHDYERKQTLANAERFVTPELRAWEEKVVSAEEQMAVLETRLFGELRRSIAQHVARLQASAHSVATLDVLTGLAHLAERRQYVRPEVHTGFRLEIRDGRHPVVETMMPREAFIPNDVLLDDSARIVILTGPNMAGKSTLLRQVGLIQLLAQMGSFVPAASARLPVCDRIFTRVGASDNLVRGQSTFMVEMQETASILNSATHASLVLLDEIGRGTATYDGVSIAWAVTEHLHERIGAKTIFATHYHELTQLADQLSGLVNFNVAVREVGQDIVFLHRLQSGGADRSYGIEVGRLAGLPGEVLTRAREILRALEGAHTSGGAGLGRDGPHAPERVAAQLWLFEPREGPVITRLRAVDPNTLTPLQALNLLSELRGLVGDADPS